MNIVLEGIDNSGKSTLANLLSARLERVVVHSGGPEKYEGEFRSRVLSFLECKAVIFDRHPCVSERIYGPIRERTLLTPDLEGLFYSTNPLIVYCRPFNRLQGHIVKERDTVQHLEQVKQNYDEILNRYEQWALARAHIIHRGDALRTIAAIEGMLK
jgi:thymidylate kinase